MANSKSLCNLCNKRVLSHCRHLQCDLCKSYVHLNCLPFVSKTDDLYIKRNNISWFCTLCMIDVLPFNHFEEDEDFITALIESRITESSINLDKLNSQNKIFTPFELNDDDMSPMLDYDPDLQYYNSISSLNQHSCNYHIEDTFNNKLSDLNITSNSLSFIHCNIRSIPKNIGKFETYLEGLNHKFSLIGLSESWLSDHSVDLYSLSGYKSVHKYRNDRMGGGVSLYIDESMEYIVREDLCLMNNTVESLFIEIDKDTINKKNELYCWCNL